MSAVTRLLPESRRDGLRAFASRSRQVVFWAAVTGAATGLFVAGFERLVVTDTFGRILGLSPWIIAVLPGLGLLVALAARRFVGGRGVSPATADEYLHAFHEPDHTLGWRAFVARTLAGLATLGSGGPMGLEGPSMYAGAVMGSNLQRRLPRMFRNADRRVLLVAGAAAGVAAIFKAPATGAVFALEVPYQDDLARNMLLPAMVSSAAGYLVFVGINGTAPLFPIAGTVDADHARPSRRCAARRRRRVGCPCLRLAPAPSQVGLGWHPSRARGAGRWGRPWRCSTRSVASSPASRSSSVRGTRSSCGPPSPGGRSGSS